MSLIYIFNLIFTMSKNYYDIINVGCEYMLENINKRLDVAIGNLDNDNFQDLFPMILDDLEYILIDFKNDRDKLSSEEQFMHSSDLRSKINVYMAKLAKVYFKFAYGIELNIINSSDYNLSMAGGGYNKNDGNIYYSDFGALLSTTSDLSFLHTCMHEGRHKVQHDAYKSDDLLSFPPHMLRLLKENLLDDSLPEDNRKFYSDNYYILFTENDAEIFARDEVHCFIKNMMQLYLKASNKREEDIDDNLMFKISEMNQLFNIILKKEEFNINEDIATQIYNSTIIKGSYSITGQQIDRIVATDKYIKTNPELQEQYPILRLLFNGKVPKSYDEIIADLEKFKEGKTEEEKMQIDNLYEEIITSDPILLLSDLLAKGQTFALDDFLKLYPTVISEYPEELKLLDEKYGCFGKFIK